MFSSQGLQKIGLNPSEKWWDAIGHMDEMPHEANWFILYLLKNKNCIWYLNEQPD